MDICKLWSHQSVYLEGVLLLVWQYQYGLVSTMSPNYQPYHSFVNNHFYIWPLNHVNTNIYKWFQPHASDELYLWCLLSYSAILGFYPTVAARGVYSITKYLHEICSWKWQRLHNHVNGPSKCPINLTILRALIANTTYFLNFWL